MFEPQDHPDDIPVSGWTADAALRQRRLDARVSDGREVRSRARRLRRSVRARVDGIASARDAWPASRAAGRISREPPSERRVRRRQSAAESGRGRVLARRSHALAARPSGTGAMYIPRRSRRTRGAAPEGGGGSWAHVHRSVAAPPQGDALKLRPVRIGLWDRYGGSSPSGWMRWLFERFEFPFEVVYAQTLDAGNLASRFDVIILTSEAVAVARHRRCPGRRTELPAEYRGDDRRDLAGAHAAAAEAVRRGRRHADRDRRRRRRLARRSDCRSRTRSSRLRATAPSGR